ncbi:geranyl transferase [Vibrio sp. qd031]|uniref:(2E,6E)-farnesyl diphosphate synthase n=1 Tax=Vibrio sp. qd031 TaxID=1603038 RepID=UPI000A11E889|nr:(2E,6E)-farnesyl diphosphate synthase [Vibrio sp. qd031]ORT50497.1 geranyl transferase [Vibrio sp. qd031]
MPHFLTPYQTRSNQQLEAWVTQHPFADHQLLKAMQYALLLGGKRIRPFLVYAVGEMLGTKPEDLDTPACAIECIHAYSLVHDDLPAMDDDELRRGKATCHIEFDEATAILAGDALQTLAFSVLADGDLAPSAQPFRINMISELAKASGAAGMCVGQAMDLEAENRAVDIAHLQAIHQHKTGALIECAVTLGALASGEKGQQILPALSEYSNKLGLAFQVQDDILDVISDTETLGKPQGSDLELNKSTYPSLLGLEGAKRKANTLLQQALHALATIPYNTQLLEDFARYVVQREY